MVKFNKKTKTLLIFQVGSSISMTYISGQPIVFVGTGQTYTDLKSLNAKVSIIFLILCCDAQNIFLVIDGHYLQAVVTALMK